MTRLSCTKKNIGGGECSCKIFAVDDAFTADECLTCVACKAKYQKPEEVPEPMPNKTFSRSSRLSRSERRKFDDALKDAKTKEGPEELKKDEEKVSE